MPYPGEHACRVREPADFETGSLRSKDLGEGIRIILGHLRDGDEAMEIQAYRFDKDKYTATQARTWLQKHKVACKKFEPASGSAEDD